MSDEPEREEVSASGGIRTKLTDEYHDELVKLGALDDIDDPHWTSWARRA